MKRFMLLLAGVMMAATLAACAPTKQDNTQKRSQPPAGAVEESSVDGALEKAQAVTDADPSVTVCVYSVKEDKSGLKQNMDAVDGEELDAQALVDKMAEMGVLESGIKVQKFENKEGVLTLDLSSLEGAADKQIITAIANTFTQNYEADQLNLSVNGEKIGDGSLTFVKDYKTLK